MKLETPGYFKHVFDHLLLYILFFNLTVVTSCVIGAPLQEKTPLAFCSYNGTSCCNSADDKQLQTQFNAMNISDPECASLVKSVICAVSRYSCRLALSSSATPIYCSLYFDYRISILL